MLATTVPILEMPCFRQASDIRAYEAFHGALQIMHRDFFREDQKLTLPSRSLEDVFSEMANDKFHFAGSIRLSASCLKCHARSRSSKDDRKAGLVITMALMKKE